MRMRRSRTFVPVTMRLATHFDNRAIADDRPADCLSRIY